MKFLITDDPEPITDRRCQALAGRQMGGTLIAPSAGEIAGGSGPSDQHPGAE